jgi:hypothetical protein
MRQFSSALLPAAKKATISAKMAVVLIRDILILT